MKASKAVNRIALPAIFLGVPVPRAPPMVIFERTRTDAPQ